jgi:stress-induced morphogen
MTNQITNAVINAFEIEILIQFGNRKSDKDFDLLIVSDDFKGMSMLKRKEFLKKIDHRLDQVCLTVDQLKQFVESKCSLFWTIKQNHLKIYGDQTNIF